MISELKDAGHTLTDEQRVQVMIRSLPQSWEHMKMHLTHNENIKTLEDAMRHLELEEDRLMACKISADVYMASSSSHGANGVSVNFMVGTSKRLKQMLKQRKKQNFNQP